MSITLKQPQYELITTGLHRAGLLAIKDRGYEDFGFGAGPVHTLELRFFVDQLNSQTGEALEITTLATHSLHRKSKMFKIAGALLGGTVPAELKEEDLIGRECQLLISHRAGKNGGTFAKIDSILPPVVVTTAPPPTPRVFPFNPQPPVPGENFTLPAAK